MQRYGSEQHRLEHIHTLPSLSQQTMYPQKNFASAAASTMIVFVLFDQWTFALSIVLALFTRLVHDKDTGRPKGFGFCEYQDAETAASAVRNLTSRELHGRTLRVDSSANAKMQQRHEDDPAAGGRCCELQSTLVMTLCLLEQLFDSACS